MITTMTKTMQVSGKRLAGTGVCCFDSLEEVTSEQKSEEREGSDTNLWGLSTPAITSATL